jgi:hypothetical protein
LLCLSSFCVLSPIAGSNKTVRLLGTRHRTKTNKTIRLLGIRHKTKTNKTIRLLGTRHRTKTVLCLVPNKRIVLFVVGSVSCPQ